MHTIYEVSDKVKHAYFVVMFQIDVVEAWKVLKTFAIVAGIYLLLKIAFVIVNEHEGIRLQIPRTVQRTIFGAVAVLSQVWFF